MRDYLLFIDTEGSGLPKKWNLPYSAENNWPYCVQVSWIIYTKDRQEVKQENYFIKDNDFTIAPSATKVHGITREFLEARGKKREQVMEVFAKDLEAYQPMVIGHFMELDAHMIGADFYRIGKENPLRSVPAFCTMLASAHLVQNPTAKYLRLFELYSMLFKKRLPDHHDALVDARATADCFFELLKRGEINEKQIEKQVTFYPKASISKKGCSLLVVIIFVFIILTAYW